MDKLSHTVDEEMNIMCTWGLTADEWLFIRLLFIAKSEGLLKPLSRYFNDCVKTGLPLDLIISLQKKKVLSKNFKAERGVDFTIDSIEFEDKFDKKYFKVSDQAGRELFNEYPSYLMLSGGKMVPIKNITKQGFNSIEDFFFVYSKSIKHSKVTHERVMESLEFAKEHKLINYLITEYVISRKWEDHIKMMDSGEIGNFVTTFDTVTTA